MTFKQALRSGVAAACIASVAAPAGIAAPAVKAVSRPSSERGGGGPDVRVATAETFSRIEINGRVTTSRNGQTVTLAMSGDPDVARLLTSPPKWIKSAARTRTAGGVQVVLTLADNADARIGQAENRLDGVPKAQVSTDLAVIYLMDRKPEQALEAINASRTTVLPNALNAERRLVEARAWTSLGRYEGALEIIERDTGKDANDLRAEILWKQKSWAAAGPLFEKSLGDRWKTATPLTTDEEGRLLRAGVAYSLAGDDGALARLQGRYQGFYEKANNPEALRIALSGAPTGRLSVADFGRVSADNEVFAGWVEKMKGRFKTRAAPVGAAKPAPAPARQAQAAVPAAKG